MSEAHERYPRCRAALEALLASSSSSTTTAPFRLGPGVLRPPPVRRAPPPPAGALEESSSSSSSSSPQPVGDLIGELVDMVLVGADEASSGRPEVHLQFKSDVIGGLHLRLEKAENGLHASFIVKDAATRRAVADHVDAIVAHLRGRGFSVVTARLEVA